MALCYNCVVHILENNLKIGVDVFSEFLWYQMITDTIYLILDKTIYRYLYILLTIF